ncbi:MAG: hypothetical protein ACI3V5_02885 [Faecousia sp.]
MGYRVEYAVPGKRKKQKHERNCRIQLLTAAFFLAFVLVVNGLWPRGADTLRRILLPGDSAVTMAAWEELTRELRAGEPIGSAVDSFCREIIRDAGLSQG